MKYLLMLMVGLAMIGSASAAEFFTVDHPSYQATMPGGRPDILITQNLDTTLIEAVQVACGVSGVSTTQNYYLRRFFLAEDHDLFGWTQFSAVAFGVEQLDMADGSTPPPYDVVVRLYQISHAAAFIFANMTPIGSATVTIHASDVGNILVANVNGFVGDASTQDLVVAIDAPDGSTIGAGLQFRPGANSLGAIHDAYLASADCGVLEPVAVGDIGFPDAQTIFVVSIYPGIVPTSTTSWGQVKAFYR